jgi:hypothetical protein
VQHGAAQVTAGGIAGYDHRCWDVSCGAMWRASGSCVSLMGHGCQCQQLGLLEVVPSLSSS